MELRCRPPLHSFPLRSHRLLPPDHWHVLYFLPKKTTMYAKAHMGYFADFATNPFAALSVDLYLQATSAASGAPVPPPSPPIPPPSPQAANPSNPSPATPSPATPSPPAPAAPGTPDLGQITSALQGGQSGTTTVANSVANSFDGGDCLPPPPPLFPRSHTPKLFNKHPGRF